MEPYHIHNAALHRFPLVVSLPHSGTYIPREIRSRMLPGVALPNADWFLRELYAFLPAMGVTTLASGVSRYVIDLNRDKEEDLDGEDFWTRLVYTHNTFGTPLYRQPPSARDVRERIRRYYDPYHAALQRLIHAKQALYPTAWLLDLHSFSVDFIEGAHEDISLSNYGHTASTPQAIGLLRDVLAGQGYRVGVNVIPGRYILKHYSRLFGSRLEAMQVELRYARYIEDRPFGEEELDHWDPALFRSAQQKLEGAFASLFRAWEAPA